eukprot:RCo006729
MSKTPDELSLSGSLGVNVQVVVRCRPPTEKEQALPLPVSAKSRTEVSISMKSGQQQVPSERIFKFDSVFGPTTSQDALYRSLIRPIVGEVLSGYSCTVFAYGQTGTGKTYTMEGLPENLVDSDGVVKLGEGAGIIPRAMQHIFSSVDRSGCEYTVKLSILELYNEELHDMLASDEELYSQDCRDSRDLGRKQARCKLGIYDVAPKTAGATPTVGGLAITGLREVPVRNMAEVLDLMRRASERRQVAETKLNAFSSRSHMITTVTVHIKETTDAGEDLWKLGKFNLVDLAGSENVTKAGVQGKGQKEAGINNQALLVLGRVINALVSNQSYVPYRASKLTRILQDSLGGKTKTCIIATVAPTHACMDETVSTLEYASRAKNIKNRPEVNRKMTRRQLMKDLSEQNEELQRQLQAQRDKSGVFLPADSYNKLIERDQEASQRIAQLEQELEVAQEHLKQADKQLAKYKRATELVRRRFDGLDTATGGMLQDLQKDFNDVSARVAKNVDLLKSQAEELGHDLNISMVGISALVQTARQKQAEGLADSQALLDTAEKGLASHLAETEACVGEFLKICSSSAAAVAEQVASVREGAGDWVRQCEQAVQAAREAYSALFSGFTESLRGHLEGAQIRLLGKVQEQCDSFAAAQLALHEEAASVSTSVADQMEKAAEQQQRVAEENDEGSDAEFNDMKHAVAAMVATLEQLGR